jgi:hypothetical protein
LKQNPQKNMRKSLCLAVLGFAIASINSSVIFPLATSQSHAVAVTAVDSARDNFAAGAFAGGKIPNQEPTTRANVLNSSNLFWNFKNAPTISYTQLLEGACQVCTRSPANEMKTESNTIAPNCGYNTHRVSQHNQIRSNCVGTVQQNNRRAEKLLFGHSIESRKTAQKFMILFYGTDAFGYCGMMFDNWYKLAPFVV